MDSVVTWPQFAMVMGLLVVVAGVGGYFVIQWYTKLLQQIHQRLDSIASTMVTKGELQVEIRQMELRLKTERLSALPPSETAA